MIKQILFIVLAIIFSSLIALAGGSGSATFNGVPIFIICASVSFILHWLAFIPAYVFQTEHYFDLIGSISYLVAMFIAVALSPSLDLRGVIVAAMVCVWALRLGSFLFMRVKKAGFDRRFTVMKTMFVRFLLTWTLGGTWVFITFAAGLTAITSEKHTDADFFLFLGGLLWLAGFSIEVIADKQKTVFRANTENAGKFIRTGLWSISRHPNYFGEMMLWLGIAVIALPTLVGWQFATLISPIFVILLISKVSGVNLLEANANERWWSDSEYQKYVASTPVIVPFLGRRTHQT